MHNTRMIDNNANKILLGKLGENRPSRKLSHGCNNKRSVESGSIRIMYEGRTESHEQLFLHANWE